MYRTKKDGIEAWVAQGYSLDEARQLKAFFEEEKRRLLKRPRTMIGAAAETQNVPRNVRNILSRRMKKLKRTGHHNFPKQMLAYPFRENALLSGLYPDRSKKWRAILDRPDTGADVRVALENFSFVHNPADTMIMFEKLVEMECSQLQARLDFLDQECLDGFEPAETVDVKHNSGSQRQTGGAGNSGPAGGKICDRTPYDLIRIRPENLRRNGAFQATISAIVVMCALHGMPWHVGYSHRIGRPALSSAA